MDWVEKIDKNALLDMDNIRGVDVITPLPQEKKCVFWSDILPRGGEQLELGSSKAIGFMQQSYINYFLVGSLGDFEVEFFYLIKGKDNVWIAHRDDCDEMFRITDLSKLDYDLVNHLISEFRFRKIKSNRNI